MFFAVIFVSVTQNYLAVFFSGVSCAEMHTSPILFSPCSWLDCLSAISSEEPSLTSAVDVLLLLSMSSASLSSASWLRYRWLLQTIQHTACGDWLPDSVPVRMDCWVLLCQQNLCHAPSVASSMLSAQLLLHSASLLCRLWHIISVDGTNSALQLLCQDS